MNILHRILVFILLAGLSSAEVLQTIAQWPLMDFALPYDRGFLNQYRPENVVPTGIEVGWDKIFVSVPRLRAGVPSTLNYIPRNLPLESSPQLQAYPSWDWHSAGKGDLNCSKLISVYRSRIDRCNRLWVVDSGIMTSIDDFMPVCMPKIMVFDLQTDQLVRQFTFPREVIFFLDSISISIILLKNEYLCLQVLRPNTLLTNLIIDDVSATTCDDVFIYMSDTAGPGLCFEISYYKFLYSIPFLMQHFTSGILVFDGATDRSWRVTHASMYPHPDYSTYRVRFITVF